MFSGNKQLLIIFIILGISIPILVIFTSSLFQVEINSTEELTDNKIHDFNFAAVGDFDCLSVTSDTVKNIIDKEPELVLGLGDYSYEDSADCWLEIVEPLKDRMKLSMGNHDDDFELEFEKIKTQFNVTQLYYSFNHQNVHFLVLASGHIVPYGIDSKQYEFVIQDLVDASSDPKINWIVVYSHHPLYLKPDRTSNFRNTYHPLFEEYNVDLVLAGHYHNYQRTYPLRYNTDVPSEPIITEYGTSHYYNPNGQIFAVVGTGGAYLHDFEGNPDFIIGRYLGYGFLDVNVKNNGTEMTSTFFSNDGTIVDQFTIKKFPQSTNYQYEPYFTLNGSNYVDIPSNPDLQLSNFSMAAWIKTNKNYDKGDSGYIVNKGGSGSEEPGKNMNYGLWMDSVEMLSASFETLNGTIYKTKSPYRLIDDIWHYSVATFDGQNLRLYLDGVPVDRISVEGLPDNTGNQTVRIGANSLKASPKNHFVGNIDEVRIWNRALTGEEITEAHVRGIFNTTGQVLYLPFNGTIVEQFTDEKLPQSTNYHYEPYLTLNGSNYVDIPSNPDLQLSNFSMAAWFKTNNDYDKGDSGYIVNKGGSGSEKPGKNMNYGLKMNSNEMLSASFETLNGTTYKIKSPYRVIDDIWHYSVVTYDGQNLRLYLDGVYLDGKSVEGLPDNTGNQAVRIGANSLKVKDHFVGNIDEVRIWNRALTGEEITEAHVRGIFNTTGQVLYLPFN